MLDKILIMPYNSKCNKQTTTNKKREVEKMFISKNVSMIKIGEEEYRLTINGNTISPVLITPSWVELYKTCRTKPVDDRASILDKFINDGKISLDDMGKTEVKEEKVEESATVALNRGLTNLISFFTEFAFEPNFRFVNTLSQKVRESKASAKNYIDNYFALMDNSYQKEIKEKMKSTEFSRILDDIKKGGAPKSVVNKRFKIYYGSAGTGKTTIAMKESDKRCIICNASMLPSDLMEDFVFVDGKATFQPSKLWRCMEEGLPIVLDEINLLPFDSLRFLQGILDGKSEFDYKGHKVTIKEGFEVIGTMNLSIGGMTYGLPEPLVDRSADIQKFVLTAEQLAKAITE